MPKVRLRVQWFGSFSNMICKIVNVFTTPSQPMRQTLLSIAGSYVAASSQNAFQAGLTTCEGSALTVVYADDIQTLLRPSSYRGPTKVVSVIVKRLGEATQRKLSGRIVWSVFGLCAPNKTTRISTYHTELLCGSTCNNLLTSAKRQKSELWVKLMNVLETVRNITLGSHL